VSTPKPNISNKFSDRVLALRKRLGFTQKRFADEIRMDRSYLSEIENGHVDPSDKIKERIEILEHQSARVSDDEPSYGSNPRFTLKKRREEKGISRADMAKRTGFKVQYIRDLEEGNVRGGNEKFLAKAAEILDLDLAALMSGSDHPPIIAPHQNTFGAKPDVVTTDNIKPKTIPLISMAQAGELVSYEDVYDYDGVIAYDGRDPRAFAVRIRGDSMAPQYSEGTIAICYPSQKPRNDNLVITKLKDGAVLFKRLQIAEGEMILHSMNPNYRPLRYTERDLVWIYPVGLTQKVEL
jgi:transcriptional regulator with XRE-family HTH domain